MTRQKLAPQSKKVFDKGMHTESDTQPFKHILACLVLSVLIHIGIAWVVEWSRPTTTPGTRQGSTAHPGETPVSRHIRLHRPAPKPPAFAKTNPDTPEQAPTHIDFEGKHNTRASGAPDTPQRSSQAPLPTMQGEQKDEIVTFDQERQDGELAHDGKKRPSPPAAAPQGSPDSSAEAPGSPAHGQNTHTPDATLATRTPAPTPDGATRLRTPQADAQPTPPAARRGLRDALFPTPHLPARRRSAQPVIHDPSLADHAQPAGFRTRERRSRSTGRFVIGSRPALNVAATPRGRYEAEIYRRIARIWYAACDEHRGDIIPGSLTISLRIDKRGHLRNMQLLSRHGAGVIQQSFTLGAIRRATLPPMPPHVASDVVGDILELIIEFHFD